MKSFEKISNIQQAKLHVSAVFENYISPNKTTRKAGDALREATKMNETAHDEFDSPLPYHRRTHLHALMT